VTRRPNRTILFLTHRVDPHELAEFERLQRECGDAYDVVLLFHTIEHRVDALPAHLRSAVFAAHEAELAALGLHDFPRAEARADGSPTIVPGNVDFLQLLYQSRHPDRAFYWVMESDVRYSGAWSEFFAEADTSTADFIATNFARRVEAPDWPWWPSLHDPAGPYTAPNALHCFCPIYRLSRRAGEVLLARYREGWCGHAEATIPTILHRAGLRLEDLGGRGPFVPPGQRDRFYSSSRLDRNLFPGTLRYRPVFGRVGRRPARLWHPVKPSEAPGNATLAWWWTHLWAAARHIVSRARQLIRRLRPRPAGRRAAGSVVLAGLLLLLCVSHRTRTTMRHAAPRPSRTAANVRPST